MKPRISIRGDRGFLYVDLLVALLIISLCGLALFAGAFQLHQARQARVTHFEQGLENYHESLESYHLAE